MFDFLFASVAVIGGADGPTEITVSGSLPLPAIFISVLAVVFIAYVYIMKAVNAKKPASPVEAPAPAAAPAPVSAPVYTGPVLEGVEEKEAAVIMAIVSDKSGIPLERLNFRSIKLIGDEKKGEVK